MRLQELELKNRALLDENQWLSDLLAQKSVDVENNSDHYYNSENMDVANKSVEDRITIAEKQNEKLKKEIDMRNRDILNLKQEIKKLGGK